MCGLDRLAPDPPDGGLRQAAALCHRGPRPVRGVSRFLLQRRDEHVVHLVQQDRRRPSRPRLSVSPSSRRAVRPRHRATVRLPSRRSPPPGCSPCPRRMPARSWPAAPGPARTSPAAPTGSAGPALVRQFQRGLRRARPRPVGQPRDPGLGEPAPHLPTVSANTPSSAATCSFTAPGFAHAITIRARAATLDEPRQARQLSTVTITQHDPGSRRTTMHHDNLVSTYNADLQVEDTSVLSR